MVIKCETVSSCYFLMLVLQKAALACHFFPGQKCGWGCASSVFGVKSFVL